MRYTYKVRELGKDIVEVVALPWQGGRGQVNKVKTWLALKRS